MISGRVVGDDAVIAWLRAVTDRAASGLARAISDLCLDLQRKALRPNVDPQVQESGDHITGTAFSGDNFGGPRGRPATGPDDARGRLRRVTCAALPSEMRCKDRPVQAAVSRKEWEPADEP